MKKVVRVEKVEGEGLMALMGEQVILLCVNYFYAGTLVGVNEKFVKLENSGIVYETGDFTASKWKDFQAIGTVYVMVQSIEAFAKGK